MVQPRTDSAPILITSASIKANAARINKQIEICNAKRKWHIGNVRIDVGPHLHHHIIRPEGNYWRRDCTRTSGLTTRYGVRRNNIGLIKIPGPRYSAGIVVSRAVGDCSRTRSVVERPIYKRAVGENFAYITHVVCTPNSA